MEIEIKIKRKVDINLLTERMIAVAEKYDGVYDVSDTILQAEAVIQELADGQGIQRFTRKYCDSLDEIGRLLGTEELKDRSAFIKVKKIKEKIKELNDRVAAHENDSVF